ncbi:MAG: cyclic nucleotide-binding domain-containing protein [Anaeromyxobacter sp.]|nr:cyclic nucleotide-binding domain-containing protein [Anaeromyxobacter sp.]MBL0275540.1 cyclic nucleotide-binding domain-containing protein [Anaeromyxobacter sp.]
MPAPDVALRAELLERTQWAHEFSFLEIETLAEYLQSRQVKKGLLVFREGDRDGTLFVIAEGKVGIIKSGAKKQDHPIATIGMGHTLGEMALIDGQPRSAGAVAVEDLILLAISRADLDRLSNEHPRLAVKLVLKVAKLLSQRLRQTTSNLADRLG